jgi:hypothetical protein
MGMGGEKSESREASHELEFMRSRSRLPKDLPGRLPAFALLMACTTSCDLFSSVETHNGIQFQRGEARVRTNGTVEKGILARDTTIQGSVYGGGSAVEFSWAGTLSSATLARDTTIQGCVYAGGSSVELTGDGRVRRGNLTAACKTEGGVAIPRGTIELDSSGHELSSVALLEDAVVEGFRFKAKTQLTFRSSNQLLRGTLAGGNAFRGIELDEGEVTFDEDGVLKHAILGSQVRVGDVRLDPGTRVTFAKDGRISCARLQSALGTAHENTQVCFDDEGKVTSRKTLPKPSPDALAGGG